MGLEAPFGDSDVVELPKDFADVVLGNAEGGAARLLELLFLNMGRVFGEEEWFVEAVPPRLQSTLTALSSHKSFKAAITLHTC